MKLPAFPPKVVSYVRSVFAQANRRVAEKLARVPNCAEPSLDLTLIEQLTQFAAPHVVAPGWTVQLDVHFLGGLRHFRQWEIADIGILVFAKKGPIVVSQKVALLQSKRLYPSNHAVVEESEYDFRLGISRLMPGGPSVAGIGIPHRFEFQNTSEYEAFGARDQQFNSIAQYEKLHGIPVHYLLYNPWRIASTYTVPSVTAPKLGRNGNGGARVIPASALRSKLALKRPGYHPTFDDVAGLCGPEAQHKHGWRLEHFVADLLLRCKQGHTFASVDDGAIDSLFYRRSGPIAAALSITIEGPSSD